MKLTCNSNSQIKLRHIFFLTDRYVHVTTVYQCTKADTVWMCEDVLSSASLTRSAKRWLFQWRLFVLSVLESYRSCFKPSLKTSSSKLQSPVGRHPGFLLKLHKSPPAPSDLSYFGCEHETTSACIRLKLSVHTLTAQSLSSVPGKSVKVQGCPTVKLFTRALSLRHFEPFMATFCKCAAAGVTVHSLVM